jgi:DNA mismatch repair protein MutS2
VLFDPKTKKPLYTLAYDQVGASQALDVAKEHGLPMEIIAKAEQNLLLQGGDASELLERLNALAVEKERELAAVAQERDRLKAKAAKLAERYEKEKKALLSELSATGQRIMREWKAGRTGQKQARQDLAELRQRVTGVVEAEAKAEPAELDFSTLAPGTAVTYLPWDKQAVVREVNVRKQQVKVDVGGVALWAGFETLAAAKGAASPAPRPRPKVAASKDSGGASDGLTLFTDVRGQRGEAAVSELSRFLDQAILRGASRIEIIHGKGTGALRREIHEFLRNFPAVKTFSLASEEEGGDGKTLVEMR